ncbi:hypothetical protein ACFFX0_26720 [Citricoccus parietis]|uniref:Uncharacterized protein n=1 Tax=Citricoccus parietis TaxID=592307 RepID=A0ABV5G6K5_9MICC
MVAAGLPGRKTAVQYGSLVDHGAESSLAWATPTILPVGWVPEGPAPAQEDPWTCQPPGRSTRTEPANGTRTGPGAARSRTTPGPRAVSG